MPYAVSWGEFAMGTTKPKNVEERYFANYSADQQERRLHAGRLAHIIKNAVNATDLSHRLGEPYDSISGRYFAEMVRVTNRISRRIDRNK